MSQNILKYSLPSLLSAYKENKDLIHAHFKGQSVEGLTNVPMQILGLALEIFMVLLVIHIILFVWALIVIAIRWKRLDTGARFVSVLCLLLLPFGSLLSLIIVYTVTSF